MPTGNIAVSTPKPAGTGPISPGLPSPTATTSKPPLGADGAQVGKTAQPTVTRPVRMFRDAIRRQLNGSLGTATLNDSFMDAMMSTPQPKKPKIVRRKISPGETAAGTSASAGQSATAIPPVCDTFQSPRVSNHCTSGKPQAEHRPRRFGGCRYGRARRGVRSRPSKDPLCRRAWKGSGCCPLLRARGRRTK